MSAKPDIYLYVDTEIIPDYLIEAYKNERRTRGRHKKI